MKRFCFILTYVQWQALLAILAELQIIVPINEVRTLLHITIISSPLRTARFPLLPDVS